MPQLIPSILETTKEGFLNIYGQETKLPGVERLQVDFGDGIFVPNKILPITEMDILNPAFHFEAHLMCQGPREFLDYKIAGFGTIIVHYEAYKSTSALISALEEIRSQGMEPAICINPETPVEVLQEFKEKIKHFQLMSVHPGFQGTPFIDKTYERILELRKLTPNAIIEIDGGVNMENIKKIADAGADYIILGSAITKAQNMPEAWDKLQSSLSSS